MEEQKDDSWVQRKQLTRSKQGQNTNDYNNLIQRIVNIARGMPEDSQTVCIEIDADCEMKEEKLLCVVSLLEIWVHKQMYELKDRHFPSTHLFDGTAI